MNAFYLAIWGNRRDERLWNFERVECTVRSMEILRLGTLQYDPIWCDVLANQAQIESLIQNGPDVDLLVLPEMSLTGFCMDSPRAHLETAQDAWLAQLARSRNMGLVYGCVEQGCNRIILLDRDGRRTGTYDKRHLFGLGGEPSSYRPGTDFVDWTFEGWRIRPAICYDLRFSYHFWDQADQIDLALVPACWPASREAHWKALLTARAIENQFYVAGVNRTGADPQIQYNGSSLVLDPNGGILLDAGSGNGVWMTEIALEKVRHQRTRFPFLPDRL